MFGNFKNVKSENRKYEIGNMAVQSPAETSRILLAGPVACQVVINSLKKTQFECSLEKIGTRAV